MLVAGGFGVHDARRDRVLVDWIRTTAPQFRRVGSVCSGTFLLGDAGLIDGRRVTTHWARADRLAAEFPSTHVDADPIFVHDGVWTSAGVTAGIDLALALVEDDLGAAHAQTVAQWLVMFLRRPGSQSQFAAPVWQQPEHDAIRSVVDAVHAEPGEPHTIASMATAASMSARHFTRLFTREVGVSPGRFVERVRIDTARRQLETTGLTTDAIARRCGFGTAETMRRSFLRSLGTPPSAYRRRFTHRPTREDHP
jgi:transcriptional regulator GlxA family with amidase domain